jgi:arylsulfatase A-like enzyme
MSTRALDRPAQHRRAAHEHTPGFDRTARGHRGLLGMLGAVAGLIALVQPAVLAEQPPNVILMNIDDMGWADIGVYDPADRIDTPRMDTLANQGIRFTDFYVNSPICSPSRCGLMTGMYPARWRIHSFVNDSTSNAARDMANFLSLDAPSLAAMFQSAGYRTANVGKWHLGGGRDIGYDVPPYDTYGTLEAPLITEYGFDETYTQFEGLGDRQLYNGEGLSNASAALESTCCPPGAGPFNITWIDKTYSSNTYIDRAIQFIADAQANDPNQPFFLSIPFDDVHSGFYPFPDLKAKYDNLYPSLPNNVRAYMAVAENLDTQIGRLVDYVDGLGLGEETLFILMADNGPEGQNVDAGSIAHLRGAKRSLYEGGVREPLILRWTGRIGPGQVNDVTVVAATDLLPSLAAMVGGTLPAGHVLDGIDLSAALLGDAMPVRYSPLFWEFGWNDTIWRAGGDRTSPNLSMRIGDWKFLVEDDGSGAELYNLGTDEGETTNVANLRPSLVDTFRSALLTWRSGLPGAEIPDETLLAHLRAEDLAVADGAPVSIWFDNTFGDRFIANVTQAEATQQPVKRAGVLGGMAAVEFDGDDYLVSGAINRLTTADDGMTIFLVTTGDQSGEIAERVAHLGSGTGAGGQVVGIDVSGSTTSQGGGAGLRFNNGAALYDTPLQMADDFHIVVVQVDHNQDYDDAVVYVDGATPAHTYTGGANASGPLDLSGVDLELVVGTGRSNSGPIQTADYFTGMLAELRVYNEQMTLAQINLVGANLAQTYGLAFATADLGGDALALADCMAGPDTPIPSRVAAPADGPADDETDVLVIEVGNGGQIRQYGVDSNGAWTLAGDFITGGAPRGFDQDPNTGDFWTVDINGPIKQLDGAGVVIDADVGEHGVDYTGAVEFIELDDAGNVYIVTGPSGTDQHVIRYEPATGIFTNQFIAQSDGANYTFSNVIRDIEIVGNRLFVADKNNNRIVEFRTDTGAFVQVFVNSGLPVPSAIEYDPVADRLLVSTDLSGVGGRSDDIVAFGGIAGQDGLPPLSTSTLINQEADDFNIHGILALDGAVYVTNLYNSGGVRQGIFRVNEASGVYDAVVSGLLQTTVIRAAHVQDQPEEGCGAFDYDGDEDVDLVDLYLLTQL